MTGYLASNFSTQPYWTDGLPPFAPVPPAFPGKVDVCVIGAGYAGLSAALTLARAGRSVAVCEAKRIDAGPAARAAGSLSHVPKATLPSLEALYGRSIADAVYREAREAREYVEQLIRENQIKCGLRGGFRFIAAHSPKAFKTKAAALAQLREAWGNVELVQRDDQRRYIGSDAFHGGIKIPNSATLQPALLQRGLALAAVNAGALFLEQTPVTGVNREADGFELETPRGRIRAREVFLATNGATDQGLAGFEEIRRRVILISAYALATEELSAELIARVVPIRGPVSDTYKILNYIAPGPDGRRLIVSARAGRREGGMEAKAHRMFAYFVDRFPDLKGVKVSHCWTGQFALTADWIPHIGVHNGVHYMIGCNGTGIPMATYLGHRSAEKILGRAQAPTAFDRPLPPLPYFGLGQPLLPLAMRWYETMDRLFH
jgi:glycine/D-amino acid oxidase-like deaminating enzyme